MCSFRRSSCFVSLACSVIKFSCILVVALLFQATRQAAFAETLVWDTRPAVNFMGASTDVAVVNGVTITTSGTRTGTFDAAGLNQHEIQPTTSLSGQTGFVFSVFNGTTDNGSNSQTTTLSFSEPVYNVSLAVGDIDGGLTYNDGTNSFSDVIEFRANGGSVLPTSGTPVDASRVNWNGTTGRATAVSNINLTDLTGAVTVTFAGPVTSLTIRHIGGDTVLSNPTQQGVSIDDVTFQRSPRLALSKISNGDFGTFNYSITNGPSGTFATSVTTTASGSPVSGSLNRLGAISTATTVTETLPSGWKIENTATCTDANAANSGNPASFSAAIASNAFTVPAGNVRSGAELTCQITNTKLPTLQLRKISYGGTRGFDFSGTNGFGAATVTTTVIGSPASIPARILTNYSTTTTLTETIPPDFILTNIACTGLGSGTASSNLTAGTVTLNAAATAPGNNIVCTYTNDRPNPALALDKTSNVPGPVAVGNAITYTYRVSNTGNLPVNNINIAETFNGNGTTPVPANEALLTDSSPGGDSTDAVANNGVWSTLAPGDVITFTASYTVVQADIDYLQ